MKRVYVSRWIAGVMAMMIAMPVSVLQAQRTIAAESGGHTIRERATVVFSRPVSLELQRVPLKQAIKAVAENASVQIHYQAEQLDAVLAPVSLHAKGATLGIVLQQLLAGTALNAVASDVDVVTIRLAPSAPAQGVLIGTVRNAKTKVPVPGVRVSVTGMSDTITTDERGTFRLVLSPGQQTVHVRGVGFQRANSTIVMEEGKTVILDLLLEPAASVLDEVIVTGTVVATARKAISTPITVITAEDIQRRGITRIDQLFRGEVPGVIVQDRGMLQYDAGIVGTGYLGNMARSDIYARGSADMDGRTNLLKTYVDGVELSDSRYLATVDPQSIERIEIITGPQAATIYGSGAMGGVMQIFTKRGSGRGSPDLMLSLKYGILENNISSGRTPSHNHALNVTGGAGAEFSYAGTASYGYTGQWQPELFDRSVGGSIGATHMRGPVKVNGSVSLTSSENGTTSLQRGNAYTRSLFETGEWQNNIGPSALGMVSQRISKSSAQTLSLGVDYSPRPFWQHHLTVGRNQMRFSIVPEAPRFAEPSDTLYWYSASENERITMGYNTTLLLSHPSWLSTTLTMGITGGRGGNGTTLGCLLNKTSTSFLPCSMASMGTVPIAVTKSSDETWGGFGTWRIGFRDAFFLTGGLRGERNPNYGEKHKIDWTPTFGATYSLELGAATIKLLGSYGRATRPPLPEQRREIVNTDPANDPAQYIGQRGNPNLTPEYSRGPQGGIEIYYGNTGSLTINRYVQTIDDLIQYLVVDSVFGMSEIFPGFIVPTVFRTSQYLNVGRVRQHGWEATGTANVGVLAFRGTYSWTDSRIVRSKLNYYQPGQMIGFIPTHTGSIGVSYAHGPTSVSLNTSIVGSSLQASGNHIEIMRLLQERIRHYTGHFAPASYPPWAKAGSAKSDLTMLHQLSSWISLSVNVTNLTDKYDSDVGTFNPTLGRKTLLGVSVRYPRR